MAGTDGLAGRPSVMAGTDGQQMRRSVRFLRGEGNPLS